jgi:hypothetical protein
MWGNPDTQMIRQKRIWSPLAKCSVDVKQKRRDEEKQQESSCLMWKEELTELSILDSVINVDSWMTVL